jgi:hypothetical protein
MLMEPKSIVAFITESSKRMECAPASRFYYPASKWFNSILEYMHARNFPQQDLFFLSFFENRIIGYNEVIEDYPKTPDPDSKMKKDMAQTVLEFLLSRYPQGTLVEIHTGKNMYADLLPLLTLHGYSYQVFAESVLLGSKHLVYQNLINQHNAIHRLKELQRDKYSILAELESRSPQEAEKIVLEYDDKARFYGVDAIFHELKMHLKKHKQQKREAFTAKEEFYGVLNKEQDLDRLETFFLGVKTLSSLFKKIDTYEAIKSQYGKLLAKFERFLIKSDYAVNTENKISEALLRLQIALLK